MAKKRKFDIRYFFIILFTAVCAEVSQLFIDLGPVVRVIGVSLIAGGIAYLVNRYDEAAEKRNNE